MPEPKRKVRKKTVVKKTAKKVDVTKLGESAALKVAKIPDTSKTDLKKLAGRFDRVDRALAKRDDLSAALLKTLSHSSDRITRRNVAANPNCNTKTSLHLAPQFPAEFLANPQFDWMLIENPSSFHKLDKNVLMGMFKRQDCPEAFLRWAADHKSDEVKLALISNKRAPKDILERFARSRNKRIADVAKAHEKLAGEISEDELDKIFFDAVRELLEGDVRDEISKKYIGLAQFPYFSSDDRLDMCQRSAESGALEIATNPDTPPKVLRKLAGSVLVLDDWQIVKEIQANPNCPNDVRSKLVAYEEGPESAAEDPDCPIDLLKKLARYERESVRSTVASNPKCPAKLRADLLRNLATSKNYWVRQQVAENPKCPVTLLNQLATDIDRSVREAVAENPNCPAHLFAKLAESEDRASVAKNPNCPADLLEELAKDTSSWVRWHVARNPNCPADLLRELAADQDDEIRQTAAANPKWSAKELRLMAEDTDGWIRWGVAENPKCPADQFAKLATDKFDEIRRAITNKRNCPTSVLERLATDKDKDIRESVAENPNCPARAFETLAADKRVDVRKAVANNPQCSAKALAKLAANKRVDIRLCVAENPMCSVELLEKLAADKTRVVRGNVPKNPNCPADLLKKLAMDKDEEVRNAVAKNSRCPVDLLEKLARDNVTVRKHVAEHPRCPTDLLNILAADNAVGVRMTAIANPSWSVARKALTNRRCRGALRTDTIESISTQAREKRIGLASAWGAKWVNDAGVIDALARDSDWRVREAVAGNPSIPTPTFQSLLGDEHEKVRLAAGLNVFHPFNDKMIRTQFAASPWMKVQLEIAEPKLRGITTAVHEGNMLSPAPKTGKALRSTSLLGRIIALSQTDTPPAELARASGYRDWRQRMAIARNPATPQKILEKLSEDSNRYVATQADATLHRDGKKSKELASRVKAVKASKAVEVDYKLLSQWVGERVSKEAENSLQISPAKLLSRPIEVWAVYVPISAWWKPNSLTVGKVQQTWDSLYGKRAPSLVDLLSDGSKVSDVDWLARLARSRHCPKELLQNLGARGVVAVRQAVAENPTCPAELLAQLSKDRSRNVRLAVAANRRCPSSILESMSASKNEELIQCIAGNPRCPKDLLKKYSRKGVEIRKSVAGNTKCPVNLLEKLATDKSSDVRSRGAENPNCPADLLEKLAKDKVWWVRSSVATNPNCPAGLLNKLARDQNTQARKGVAESPNWSVNELRRMAEDADKWIRAGVAKNPKCPADPLRKLATDKSPDVRSGAADNPKCPVNLLVKLVSDDNWWVYHYAFEALYRIKHEGGVLPTGIPNYDA